MKLDYKIIWVEDKIDTKPFISLKKNVQEHLENEFFNVSIETAEDFDEFKKKYENNETFDLIITDLNLNESHGNEVIDFVRDEKHILTEIFFYSANRELTSTQLINNSRITFHQMDEASAYRELGSSIIELIDLTISKFQHIVTMRGMIMQETSSLDLKMENIVKSQLKNLAISESIGPMLEKIFDNILENATEKFNKAKARKAKIVLKDNVLFNASQKIFALGEILNIFEEENFSEEYANEINLIRNQFAHSELMKDSKGNEYFKVKGEDVYFDKDLCRDIRKNINKHIINILKIEEKIKQKT
jgi:CheY-like chemotaxis protein